MFKTRPIFVAFIIICTFFLSGCDKKASDEIDFGVVENLVYRNQYFGFSIQIPPNWSIIHDQETLQIIMNKGADIVIKEDKHIDDVLKASELQMVFFFVASKYPFTSDPSVNCLADTVRHVPVIKKGKDYLFHIKNDLEASKIEISFPKEIYTETLGGIDFDVLTAQMSFAGRTIKQKQYVTVMKGYALVCTVAFTNYDEEAELAEILNSIKFN